jgi:hypothetical protein
MRNLIDIQFSIIQNNSMESILISVSENPGISIDEFLKKNIGQV